jgi:transcriptional regulator with XRE-family HTH domain
MKSIGQKIRKIRELKGFSQDYVASRLDMSQNNYSKIELEHNKKLSAERLDEIAKILEVDPNEILNFDDTFLFKSISHNQTGGETKSGIFNNDAIIKSLNEEIQHLRSENIRLISIIEKTLKS